MIRHIGKVILLAGILIRLSLSASPAAGDAPTATVPAGRWTILARTALLFPADAEYRKLYGERRPYFELKVGADIARNLYLWGAWGFFCGTGTIPLVDEKAESFQNILSFGAGFRLRITPRLGARAEVGFSRIGYKDKAMGLEVSGSGIGPRAGVSGFYIFSRTVFAEVGLDWTHASSITEDGLELRLGGWILGAGLGLRF
ncbi:MAG: hypothetical protein ABSG73_15085 [Candidatus Aminicenantales bacterium]|jgi:hypothetical protein